MCKFKSGLIMKDRVFIPDYDSHSKMLDELKIEDTRANAERLFIRAELYPKDGDVFSDIDTWTFNVDQDIRPEWYVEEVDKARMITAVKEWAKTHIYVGVDNLKLEGGSGYYIKDCKDVEIYGSASVENICGSASVENICGSASVENICGSASVKYIYGSASVENICGSASVKYICGSASVENICGSASVKYICGSASVKYICGSASVKYIYDSASVENICGSASVKYICGSASVKYICGSASVENICGSASVENIYDSASVEKAKGYSVIVGSPYGWKNSTKLILSENATFKDCQAKVIYQSGGWELRSV